MGFVQAVVFGREENRPSPEIFVAVMTVEPWFDRISFAHVNRWKGTVFAGTNQNVHTCSLKLKATRNGFVVAAIEDNSDAGPQRAFYQAQTVGITGRQKDLD